MDAPAGTPRRRPLFLVLKKVTTKNYEIYEVSVADSCQRRLTSLNGDEFYPIVSKDGKKLIFTATASGAEQIHQMDYPSPFKCEFKY